MAATTNGHAAANAAVEKAFTIHVTNLPFALEQDAVRGLFEKYGTLTGILVFPKKNNTQEAYISYGKYVEAETAINEMDKVPPLNLYIEFKDKELRAKSHQEEIKIHLDEPYFDHRYQDGQVDDRYTRKSMNMGKPKCTPSAYQVANYTPEDELLCPVPTDPSMCNPYEQMGPYKDLNLMYSRGMTQVLTDGRRRICMGRGYTFYDLPEPHHNIGSLVANVCEVRNANVYEYAPDDMSDDTGICKMCSSPTAFRCQKCSVTFYCSRPCQLKDWPQHKLECQIIPNLVKKIPSSMSLNGHEAPKHNGHEAPPKSQVDAYPREPEPQLRRPRPLPPRHQPQHQQPPQNYQQQHQQHERQQSPPRYNRDQQQQQQQQGSPARFNRPQQQQQQRSPPNALQETIPPKSPASVKSHRSNDDANRQTPVSAFKAESTSFPAKQQKPTGPKSVPSDDGFGSFVPKDWFISKDSFEKVFITARVEDGEYWVQKVDNCDDIDTVFKKLKAHAQTKSPIEPCVNLKCALEYEGEWYRLTVQEIRDDIMRIFFLDFGTSEDITVSKVIPMDGFEDVPYLSRKIYLVENTDPKLMKLEPGSSVYVKAISLKDTGALIVEAKEDEKQGKEQPAASSTPAVPASPRKSVPPSPRKPTQWEIAVEKLVTLPSILDSLSVGQSGLAICHAQLAKDELNISLVPEELMEPFESLVETFATACLKQVAQYPDYEPIIGDFICAQQQTGDWFRGIVISLNPVKLAVVDEARVFVPVKCAPLPKGFHEIAVFGLLMKLNANADLATQTLLFNVIKVSPSKDSAVISLAAEDGSPKGEATLIKWTPKPEQKGLACTKLTSGREVQIMEAISQNTIYVHSKEPEEVERRHRLEQEIAKCALNRKPLRDLPVVGQIVMALYNDGNYYRAYVVRVESKANIQIKYMDYGNDSNVKFDNLFELPSELKEERACATKIKLKGVKEDIPMTEDATAYLTELISHEVALTCTFTGNPTTDGVILKTPKNEIVNEQLVEFLKPSWEKDEKKELEDKEILMISHLPALKLGDVGDQVQALVLCFYASPLNVMLAPNDETVVTAIYEDMFKRIQEYVKNTPTHYIPREKELCIALFEGVYYRAVCMVSSATPDASRVFFMDYGNTDVVKHKDIRMMTKDFMTFGPLAIICNLSPMVPDEKVTPAISEKLSELLVINELVTVKIISEDEKDGMPYIDIPDAHVALIDAKLL